MQNKIVKHHKNVKIKYPELTGETEMLDLGLMGDFQYFSCSLNLTFPEQEKGVEIITLSYDTDLEEIIKLKKDSPLIKSINAHIQYQIREHYTLEDELKALRTNDEEYRAIIDNIRLAGQTEKLRLGFGVIENTTDDEE